MPPLLHRTAKLLPCALLVLAAAADAQLDLPGKPKPRPKDPGAELLPPQPARGDVAPHQPGEGDPLELPGGMAASVPGAPVPLVVPAPFPLGPGAASEAARAVFADLARTRDPSRATLAADRLLALGPDALALARAELSSPHGPSLLAAGHVLLCGGAEADRAAVAERLTRPVPGECVVLVDELVARDPVVASPAYLARLLDHPSTGVRSAAQKALSTRVSTAVLPNLAPLLDSRRTATRLAALDLVGRVPDPAAWNLMASRLGDSSAEVARRAANLLASVDECETLLLERAFPPEETHGPLGWTRARAYALLGVVEREETGQRVILGEAHVAALLGGLASPQPLVAGAAATALARVGFRASPSTNAGATWLDRDVPHTLVRCGTGAEFHGDFSSLERPALRALALLSGEEFGADGEAWRRWWIGAAETFHARRAVIEPGPEAAARIRVTFDDEDGRTFTVVGPEFDGTLAAPSARASSPSSPVRLDASAAARLVARLEEEGAFGVRRLPGGTHTGAERALVVAIDAQEKRFAHVPGVAPWCDDLRAELAALVDENRWQLLFDPARTTALEWWTAEHERWAGLAPLERRRSLKDLLLAAARRAPQHEREELVAELELVLAEIGVPEAADLEPLLALVSLEREYGPRAERLLELARVAAGLGTVQAPEAAPRERLLALALERFGPEADPALARLARDLGPEVLTHLAGDSRPRVRGLVAPGLLEEGLEEAALALLDDPDSSVELATLAALAEHPVESARPALMTRARSGSPARRAAALRALARLGGKDVQDLAMESVGEPEPIVQLAAVAVLADLALPESASLLASLLVRGPSSPLYMQARRGLVRLGQPGIDECLRLTRGPGARAKREAALLLAEALAPDAAPLLLTLISEDPEDERAEWELSVLSGLDLAAAEEPARAGWDWWDLVVHDDPLAWLLAAAERAGVPAPPRAELERGSTSERAARFLLTLAELPAPQLVERAARELERALATTFERPRNAAGRAPFLAEMRAAVDARYGR